MTAETQSQLTDLERRLERLAAAGVEIEISVLPTAGLVEWLMLCTLAKRNPFEHVFDLEADSLTELVSSAESECLRRGWLPSGEGEG